MDIDQKKTSAKRKLRAKRAGERRTKEIGTVGERDIKKA